MLFIYLFFFFNGIDAARSFVKKEKKKNVLNNEKVKGSFKRYFKKFEFYKTCAFRRI